MLASSVRTQIARRVDLYLPRRRLSLPYKGFELVYSSSTSLVERIRSQGEYEPEVTRAVAEAVAASPGRTLVDVGANIGLTTLGVLAEVPDAHVFAFEPGRHQHDLFRETIRRNGLEDRVALSPLALSDREGTASFAVHASRHASGDGFVDTGRAGMTRTVTVETETLDRWWRHSGTPRIDVLKIDTEGAELMVLRAAEGVLEACRPTIFLEIHPLNLRGYPYEPEDVRRFLVAHGFELEAVAGDSDLVARPA